MPHKTKVGGLAITTVLMLGAGVALFLTISNMSPALRRLTRGQMAMAESEGLLGLGFFGL